MKRYLIIPAALVALVACGGDDDDIDARYVPAAVEEEPIDVLALNAVWPSVEDEICGLLLDMGGLTPEIADLAIASYNDGYGEPLSRQGERRLIELLERC